LLLRFPLLVFAPLVPSALLLRVCNSEPTEPDLFPRLFFFRSLLGFSPQSPDKSAISSHDLTESTLVKELLSKANEALVQCSEMSSLSKKLPLLRSNIAISKMSWSTILLETAGVGVAVLLLTFIVSPRFLALLLCDASEGEWAVSCEECDSPSRLLLPLLFGCFASAELSWVLDDVTMLFLISRPLLLASPFVLELCRTLCRVPVCDLERARSLSDLISRWCEVFAVDDRLLDDKEFLHLDDSLLLFSSLECFPLINASAVGCLVGYLLLLLLLDLSTEAFQAFHSPSVSKVV